MVPRVGHRLREPGWSAHFVGGVFDGKLLEYSFMRITEAARRLGTSARMLRYREDLGLLPQVRERPVGSRRGPVSGRGAGFGAESGGFWSGASGGAVSGRAGSGAALPGRRFPGQRAGRRTACLAEEDVEAVAAALELERRYDISPAALAFGVRVLAEPRCGPRWPTWAGGWAAFRPRPAGPWTSRRRRALRLLQWPGGRGHGAVAGSAEGPDGGALDVAVFEGG